MRVEQTGEGGGHKVTKEGETTTVGGPKWANPAQRR
jgi:hypothetical protein